MRGPPRSPWPRLHTAPGGFWFSVNVFWDLRQRRLALPVDSLRCSGRVDQGTLAVLSDNHLVQLRLVSPVTCGPPSPVRVSILRPPEAERFRVAVRHRELPQPNFGIVQRSATAPTRDETVGTSTNYRCVNSCGASFGNSLTGRSV